MHVYGNSMRGEGSASNHRVICKRDFFFFFYDEVYIGHNISILIYIPYISVQIISLYNQYLEKI